MGYVDRMGVKYTTKWGMHLAGMNFQTRSILFGYVRQKLGRFLDGEKDLWKLVLDIFWWK